MNKYDDIKLIGLFGLAETGKDTIASLIKDDGWKRYAFADSLKNLCIDYLGLSRDDVFTQEGKQSFNPFWNMTNREILQKVGTDAMRNGFNSEVWVKILELKVKKELEEGNKVIVTDCRFDNEAAMIERLGGIVFKVSRPQKENNLNESEKYHISESGISEKYFSETILNDNTIENLKVQFFGKLSEFELKQKSIIDRIVNITNEFNVNQEIAEKLIFCIKKYVKINIDFVINQDNELRFEWNSVDFNRFLVTDTYNNILKFKSVLRDGTIEAEYEFSFDDVNTWNKINQLF